MAKNRSPAFQFYPDKWLAGTMHLDAESYRAYHHVLCWMWQHALDYCSMPDTDDAWRMATGLKDIVLVQCRKAIMHPDMEMFKKRNGKLTSRGLQKEAKKQKIYRAKQRKNALTRWGRGVTSMPPDIPPDIPPDMQSLCSSSLTLIPTHIPKEEDKIARTGKPSVPTSRIKVTDEAWIETLRPDCIKQGIDLDAEIIKAKRWLLKRPKRRFTQNFFINWLNNADKTIGGFENGNRNNGTNRDHRSEKASREFEENIHAPDFN